MIPPEKNTDAESLHPTFWKQLYVYRKNNMDLGQLLFKIACERYIRLFYV